MVTRSRAGAMPQQRTQGNIARESGAWPPCKPRLRCYPREVRTGASALAPKPRCSFLIGVPRTGFQRRLSAEALEPKGEQD